MLSIAVALLLGAHPPQTPTGSPVAPARVASAPVTLAQLRELLAIAAPDATIASELEARGASFRIDGEALAELERSGAGAKTLAALRTLQPKGTLVVRAHIGAAQVYVGGELVGATPSDGELRVSVLAGDINVVVKKAGYLDAAVVTKTVEKGQEASIEVTLEMIPLRVGGNIKPPTKLKHVEPKYPSDARAARRQGIVILEVTIAVDGTVKDAKLLRPIPMLNDAAIEAARQWVFAPTLLNGIPVPVILTATVQFTLPD